MATVSHRRCQQDESRFCSREQNLEEVSTSTKVIGYLELIFIQLNGGSGNSLYQKIYDPVLIFPKQDL